MKLKLPLFMAFNFIQIIFFIYVLVVRTCAASHEQECLALFEFKQSILHQRYALFNVGGFQKLDSWRRITNNASGHGFDCCLWDGVVCSDNGYVIGLDLSQSSLHGPIKSNCSLFNLVHLQMLNLSMNDFVGSQIPSDIARLKQLRSLDLSDSGLSGQIPIEISHLMQLNFLDLSANPLKLQRGGFDYMVQNLTRLEEFNLSGVDISSSVPAFLANVSSLRLIHLRDCRLQDEFPSAIFHLPKLKFLSMANNPNLTGFLPEFQNNSLLEGLSLSTTSFAGSIPESISKLKHLVLLSLSENYLSGCIPRSLSNMTQLNHLALGQDEFMGLNPSLPSLLPNSVGVEICEKGHTHEWIGKLTNLEVLLLDSVNINGEILPSLANLTKLSFLEMRECAIDGNIPSSFMKLTNLRVIDLTRNQLQGQISSFSSNFKSLDYLDLSNNNFSGTLDINTFIGLTKVKTLFLDYNRISFVETNNHTNEALLPELEYLGLSSCNLIEFPSFLHFQKKLSTLLLADNKIDGLVPEWILKNTKETLQLLDLSGNSITGFHQYYHFLPWVHLEAFFISDNQLRGPLPIPPLTMITYDVSNNNLIGEMPPSICEAKSLQVLDLSYNNMTGTIPSCFANLNNSLLYLDLKRNNFHGRMMNSFTHESPIEHIDLSENNFTGRLPKSLANCTNLKVLVLGGNSFVDVFPFWLGTLPKLEVLVLQSNKLHGAIHDLTTINSQFSKLRIIDLSNNDFSGQLDGKFVQKLNELRSVNVGKSYKKEPTLYIQDFGGFSVPYSLTLTNKGAKREYDNNVIKIFTAIDLSCDNFEGQIPQSLGDLLGLESLNLSNNHFTGHVLPSLGNLKNLESLDLSRNELSGEIPHELSQLSFLEIFNVSFNNLHGRIPQGKQFNTFDESSYMGNPSLCGEVLYKECQNSQPSTLAPTGNESVSLLPTDGLDFIIISLGVASGLVIGIILGNLLYAKYNDWFVERFKLRKDKWVRPLSNKSKN